MRAINNIQNNYKIRQINFTSEPQKETKEKELNNTQKCLIYVGLTTLAIIGMSIVTRGRGANQPIPRAKENPTPQGVSIEVKALKDKITRLKETIKTKYALERKKIDKNANELKLNAFQSNCLKNAKNGKINANKIESIMDFDRTIKYIRESKHEGKSLADLQADIKNYTKVLKAKLQELSNDSDWIELRKLRHKIQIAQCKDPNDFGRLLLIDEVLFSKANKEISPYLQILNLSVEDAIKLIKSPNIVNEYNQIFKIAKENNPEKIKRLSIVKQNFGYKLSVDKLFMAKIENEDILNAINNANDASRKIQRIEQSITDLLEQKQNYQTKVIDLAIKTRQSPEVKELRDLLAQLKTLENKT